MDINKTLEDHTNWLNNVEGGIMADLSGADLRRSNLSGVDLRGANLSGADLSGADLRRSNLSGADLSGADLRRSNLSGADLSGASLSESNLSGADLSGADLRRSNLSGADLRRSNLSGADLSGAYLRESNLYKTSVFCFQAGGHFAWYHEGYVKIGCLGESIEYWIEHYIEIGRGKGYSPEQIDLYGQWLKMMYGMRYEQRSWTPWDLSENELIEVFEKNY